MGVYQETRKNGTVKWIIEYFKDGRRKREVTPARTRKQAELCLARRKIEIEDGKWTDRKQIKRIKFKDHAEEYLELKRLQDPKAIDRVELSLKYLILFFGKFYLDSITSKDILRYISKRRKTTRKRPPYNPIAPATINRELACLRNLLREAMKNESIEKNPMFGISLLKEDNVRNRCLSEEEYQRLLEVVPRHLYGVILCAIETGMRKMEILNLTWDQVDLKKRFIYLQGSDTKTGYGRKIPISPALYEYLYNLPHSIKSDHVFLYHGKPFHEFTTSWNNVRRRVNLKDFRFHDFRHTFVTRMRKAGIHDHVIMAITGHKTRDMFKRYDTVDDEDLLAAMHNLCAPQDGDTKEKSTQNLEEGASSGARRGKRLGRPRVNS